MFSHIEWQSPTVNDKVLLVMPQDFPRFNLKNACSGAATPVNNWSRKKPWRLNINVLGKSRSDCFINYGYKLTTCTNYLLSTREVLFLWVGHKVRLNHQFSGHISKNHAKSFRKAVLDKKNRFLDKIVSSLQRHSNVKKEAKILTFLDQLFTCSTRFFANL